VYYYDSTVGVAGGLVKTLVENYFGAWLRSWSRVGSPGVATPGLLSYGADFYAASTTAALACPIRVTFTFNTTRLDIGSGSPATTFSGHSGSGVS
jgi:hypothetical protein